MWLHNPADFRLGIASSPEKRNGISGKTEKDFIRKKRGNRLRVALGFLSEGRFGTRHAWPLTNLGLQQPFFPSEPDCESPPIPRFDDNDTKRNSAWRYRGIQKIFCQGHRFWLTRFSDRATAVFGDFIGQRISANRGDFHCDHRLYLDDIHEQLRDDNQGSCGGNDSDRDGMHHGVWGRWNERRMESAGLIGLRHDLSRHHRRINSPNSLWII